MDSAGWTDIFAFSTADTFRMIWRIYYINIHLADSAAFLATNTFLMIHLDLKKRYFVKQRVDSTKWADPFTEWTVKQDAQDDEKHKDRKLKRKQVSECSTDS